VKYIILTVAVLVICFGLAYLPARLLHFSAPRKMFKRLVVTFLFGIVLMALVGLGYLSVYYSAGTQALAALQGNAYVSVQEIDGGYFFDGPGRSDAIVFYPGAKVDAAAYAPLLQLAEAGYDCFLAEMPAHIALLDSNAADAFISAYAYDTWIMAGHSMGGMVEAISAFFG